MVQIIFLSHTMSTIVILQPLRHFIRLWQFNGFIGGGQGQDSIENESMLQVFASRTLHIEMQVNPHLFRSGTKTHQIIIRLDRPIQAE